MGILKLKQTTHDGRSKIWKLEEKKNLQTFGSSRKAQIVSIDAESSRYQSAFEHRDDGWHYVSFDLKDSNPDIKITKETIIHLSQSTLQFEIIEKNEFLSQNFNQLETEGSEKKQMYLVLLNGRILESYVGPTGSPFEYYYNGKKESFNLTASSTWVEQPFNELIIKSKLISTESMKYLSQMPKNSVMDEQSRRTLVITLGFTSLFVFLSFLTPQKEVVVEELALPRKATNVIFKTEKRKPPEAQEVKPQVAKAQARPDNQPAPSAAQPAGGKVSALLKGAVGVRISQLLGKVSATEARNANVIVQAAGIKAGEGPSGRALAAVGKVEQSGRNWNGESAGKGTGVSTAGIGGGNGVAALGGGLGQGKTGSGGVGLIEDESEISGGLDREVIAQYIKTQLGQILYCYERQLSANPDLYGKVAVRFTISGNGQVITQNINDSTLKNSSVEGCILNKVAKWKFPEPKGGTKVNVTYPFLFKSTN